MNQTDIYRILYPTTEEYTFFACRNGVFSRIHFVLGQKQMLTNVKVESIPKVYFFEPSNMKVEINNKKKTGKFINV